MDNYELRYLPIFFDDLEHASFYIASTLRNPKAADDLVDEVEDAILKRVPICEDFEPYNSLKENTSIIVEYVVPQLEGFWWQEDVAGNSCFDG